MKKTLLIFLFVGISCFVFASSGTSPEALKPVESETDWSKISAIATCVAALTGIVAVYVYWKALKENQKLSKISYEQVRIQNSNVLYEVYKKIIDKQHVAKGEQASIVMNSSKGVTIKEFFTLIKSGGASWINSEFNRSYKSLSQLVSKINFGILREIDRNLTLTPAHKLALIYCFGEYYGLSEALFEDGFIDFDFAYVEYDKAYNATMTQVKFSKTPIYQVLREYNVLYFKYLNKMGA